jgi:hypothetical protein
MYDLYAVCVAGLNRLIPRHLSESRVVYGQAGNGPLMAVRARKRCANPRGDKYQISWLVTGQRSNQLNYVPNRGINNLA